jgi:N-acetylglucosamine kinase-like BadF-type ATPase
MTGNPAAGIPAVLAIDGGNSKTDAALAAADGSLLGRGRGPGVPGMLAAGQTLDALEAAVRAAQHDAGLPAGQPVARHLAACVANADLPEEEAELARLLRDLGWAERTQVANDTFAVLRAGLADTPADSAGYWGVAVVCGAGINCVGVAPDGRIWRYLALGPISGDWGGGEALAQEAIRCAARAEDGRGPDTALRDAVARHFGVPSMRDVAVGLHTGKLPWQARHGLPPVLFAVAASGDAVARDIVSRLAREAATMALTAMRHLGMADRDVPVVLGGGVLTARDPLLIREIAERLRAGAPRAELRVVDIPPVAGAALLGLDHITAPDSAKARLRAAFGGAEPPPPRHPSRTRRPARQRR